MSEPSTVRTRMSKERRREQLLDAAAELLVDRGSAAVTMERLAEWAGVSKALPYSHFENADEVLVALHTRVVGELGARVLDALRDADDDCDLVRLIVTTYLDAVRDLGPVLGAVTSPGSRSSELGDADGTVGPSFVTHVLTRYLDVPTDRARAASPILLSALAGAVRSWRTRQGSREEIEALAEGVLRSLAGGTP